MVAPLKGDIGAIAPTICARLVANKYLFFTKPSYHPSREVGTLCTDPCAWMVLRVREKKVFIGSQTCTNCWRNSTDVNRTDHNTDKGDGGWPISNHSRLHMVHIGLYQPKLPHEMGGSVHNRFHHHHFPPWRGGFIVGRSVS